MSTIKALIFDFGGVLVRTMDLQGRKKWEKRLGLHPGELSNIVFNSEIAIVATSGRVDELAIWQHVKERFRLTDPELEELQTDFWSGDQVNHELVDFIRGLRGSIKTAILSNAWSGARQLFTLKYQLDGAFDLIIISAEEGIAKPDPQIFRLALGRLGVSSQEAIFVDDVIENVEAARSLGIHGILFKATPQVIQDIQTVIT